MIMIMIMIIMIMMRMMMVMMTYKNLLIVIVSRNPSLGAFFSPTMMHVKRTERLCIMTVYTLDLTPQICIF